MTFCRLNPAYLCSIISLNRVCYGFSIACCCPGKHCNIHQIWCDILIVIDLLFCDIFSTSCITIVLTFATLLTLSICFAYKIILMGPETAGFLCSDLRMFMANAVWFTEVVWSYRNCLPRQCVGYDHKTAKSHRVCLPMDCVK